MNNIWIGIKRFFKNKNTVTIIALIASLAILYFAYEMRIKAETAPVNVPYAENSIGPRTYITEDMVSIKKVPGGVVNTEVILNRSEIIGKYVNKDAVVPQNGLFYRSAVVKWDEISDAIYSDIPDGHTIVYLAVNQNTTYGNSIYPGNYIDLYYHGYLNGKRTIGKFIESIKVLGVTDSSGNNVFETNTNPKSPRYLIFSVDEEYHLLLKWAIYTEGEDAIFPVPRNASYSENPKPTAIVNAQIEEFIKSRVHNYGLEENDEKISG